jgi:hypothetical protein
VNPSVCCYPIPGKPKAARTCEAFAAGVSRCGERVDVYREPPSELGPGAAVFYGVRPSVKHLWEQAKRERRDWYYIDNAYFDPARETYFRVTKNAIQHTGTGESDGSRFAALGLDVKPMRDGVTVLVCPQSAEFMSAVAGDPGWRERVTRNLKRRYGERVIVREKGAARPLREDLAQAGLLVTWSSAAAVMALLDGVRVMCAPECAATFAGEDRRAWASVLADNEWTLEELAAGAAWRGINGA